MGPEQRRRPERYREAAEAAWRWVLDQVRWQDGPWIPEQVPAADEPPPLRDGLHSGIGGLAHVLAEIRHTRPWTAEEQRLADGIVERVRTEAETTTDCTFFDGLVSTVGVLVALGADGIEAVLGRLEQLAALDGWPQSAFGPPRCLPGARINDLTLGTAGVVVGALWADRLGVPGGRRLVERAAEVLMAEKEDLPTGASWTFVPLRFRTDPAIEMPNLSHGLAGIAAALALAGRELHRPDLTAAARSGAEHLVSLGRVEGDGFVVPRYLPRDAVADVDEVTYTWCHGATGTSLLFLALDHAGVQDVAGEPPLSWHRRCLDSVRASGLPQRLHPGFWDNDGRCCGTAGVADVFLDSWHRTGDERDLEFALRLADTLVERAVREGPHAYWRFVEHRAADPLLPPGVGWMQGAAGIAALLFRAGRVAERGRQADAVARMDTWWALPQPSSPTPSRE